MTTFHAAYRLPVRNIPDVIRLGKDADGAETEYFLSQPIAANPALAGKTA